MAVDALIDGPIPFGISKPGFAFDMRPGLSVSDWSFDDTYAWPVPSGLSPITLLPAPLDPLWETTVYDGTQATEPYRRYTEDHFNITGGSGVTRYPKLNPTDWVLLTKGTNTTFSSLEDLDTGEGLFMTLTPSGSQSTNKVVLTTQFGHPDPTKAFWFTLYEDGRGYLARGNTPIGVTDVDKQLAQGSLVPDKFGSIIGKELKLFFLPHGRNRLLICSSTGNGFMYEDKRIPRSNPLSNTRGNAPVLLGANPTNINLLDNTPPIMKKAPYHITTYPKTVLRARPIPYKSPEGNIRAKYPSLFQYSGYPSSGPPLTEGQITGNVGFDLMGMSPNGPNSPYAVVHHNPTPVKEEVNALVPTVTLRRPDKKPSDVNKTPQFYRNEASVSHVPATKTDSHVSIMPDIITLSHNQSEDGLTGRVKLANADQHIAYATGFGIPFEYSEDNNVWVRGRLLSPNWEDKGQPASTDGPAGMRVQYLEWTLQGFEKDLEEGFVQDETRLDGLSLDDAAKKVLISLGFPEDGSQWDIDTTPVLADGSKDKKLGNYLSEGEADSEPTNLTDVAKSGMDWLKYIVETYTSAASYPFHWVMGFRPYFNTGTSKYEWRFFLKNPDKFSGTSLYTFFPTEEIAIANSSATYQNAYKYVHQGSMKFEFQEPETNHLYMFGMEDSIRQDKEDVSADVSEGNSKDRVLSIEIPDKPSMDGDLALNSRPKNWLGKDKRVVYIDASLNTQDLLNEAAGKLFPRISTARMTTMVEAEWNPLIKIWDVVTTWTWKANVTPGAYATMASTGSNFDKYDWRVTGIDIEHVRDSATDKGLVQRRRARYHLTRWWS